MSTPKTIKGYPDMYMEVIKHIAREPGLKIELPFDEVKQARTFRLRFNSFKVMALRDGLADAGDLQVLIKREPTRVVIQHKDHTDEALMIKKILKSV